MHQHNILHLSSVLHILFSSLPFFPFSFLSYRISIHHPSIELSIIMESSLFDDKMNYSMEHAQILPHFKNPIKLKELVGSQRVMFEIDSEALADKDTMLLEDDYEDEYDDYGDDERPITETNPKRYATARKKRGLLESFGVDPEISFVSFYDQEQFKKMKDVLPAKEGAVRKTIIREGTGPTTIPENCKAFVHYIICGDGMTDPFDSTVNRGYPHCIDLRAPDVLPGLFAGIKSMKIREVAKFFIRCDFAYGHFGCPPRIPPNLDVHCIVELLDVIEENNLKLVPFMTNEERAALDFKEVYEAAKEMRLKGNSDYVDCAYWPAVKRYRKAINILEDYGTQNQADQDLRQDMLYTIYMNLSATYLKLRRPQQVCVCCKLAQRCINFVNKTGGEKLYYRFAEAKLMLGSTKDAKNLNREALLRSPKDSLILEQKKRILAQIEGDELATKMTYAKIGKAFCSDSSKSKTAVTSASVKQEKSPKPSKTVTPVKQEEFPKLSKTEEISKKVERPTKVQVQDEDNGNKIPELPTCKQESEEKTTGKISPPLEWEEYEQYEDTFREPTTYKRF